MMDSTKDSEAETSQPKRRRVERQKPEKISTEDWEALQTRTENYKTTKKLQKPPLDFDGWMRERDLCRDKKNDPEFQSDHFLFNIAFFCNTNRLWDVVTRELQAAIEDLPKKEQVVIIFLLRMAGSSREQEKPGRSGAAGIKAHMENLPEYIKTMPFTGRKTYRAVLNRKELSIIYDTVAEDLASLDRCASLDNTSDKIVAAIREAGEKHAEELSDTKHNTERKLDFHPMQIACDLFTLGLVKLDDNGCDCPSATGSRAGLKHVMRWENNLAATTIKSLAEATGREPHEVQTSLCEYNKYVKWWNGSANYKPR